MVSTITRDGLRIEFFWKSTPLRGEITSITGELAQDFDRILAARPLVYVRAGEKRVTSLEYLLQVLGNLEPLALAVVDPPLDLPHADNAIP